MRILCAGYVVGARILCAGYVVGVRILCAGYVVGARSLLCSGVGVSIVLCFVAWIRHVVLPLV